jgi:regulator of sigma E protease
VPQSDLTGGSAVELLDILGMIPRVAVVGVILDTPADRAGLKPGDIIYEYGDVRSPTKEQLDEINDRSAEGGAGMVLLRDEKVLPPVHVVPKASPAGAKMGFLPIPDLRHTVIAGVRPGSPAASAGLRGGDLVEQVDGRPVQTWIDIYRGVCQAQGHDLSVQVKRGEQTIQADLGPVSRRFFDPSDYRFSPFGGGVVFEPLTLTVRKGPLEAAAWGVNQTWEFIISQYAWLRQLVAGKASPKEDAAGPLRVGQLAVLAARKGPMHLVYLMAVISACVAVINFLPFPVLDGGHAAMLVLEKIRGRPLPVKVQWAVQVFGLACILVLFLLLTWNDLVHMLGGS